MKIALLSDGVSDLGARPDLLILDTIEAIEGVLVAEGNEVVRVSAHTDARWVERVRRGSFDLIFNLCEGIDGTAAFEPAAISILELLGVPFTGGSSWSTALSLRKHAVNSILDRAGLPVPRFALAHAGAPLPTVGFPAICKPAAEDASIGIEQSSVVRTARALATRVEAMHERWPEVLVQRYIDGREVNVGILGEAVLPISEIHFDKMPRGKWRIVSYRAKWESGSDEDVGTRPHCPADLRPKLAAEVKSMAMAAWRLLGGHGYGRVDMRIDRAGRPWILEVNANPDMAPDAGFARMALAAGMDYGALVRTVCELALEHHALAAERGGTMTQRLSGAVAITEATALDMFSTGR
jgi:D-alanine-D-alanine ligase